MVAHAYNPSTQEVETGQEFEVVLSYNSEFDASKGYVRWSLKETENEEIKRCERYQKAVGRLSICKR